MVNSFFFGMGRCYNLLEGLSRKPQGEQIPSERGRRGSNRMSSTVAVAVCWGSLGRHGTMVIRRFQWRKGYLAGLVAVLS